MKECWKSPGLLALIFAIAGQACGQRFEIAKSSVQAESESQQTVEATNVPPPPTTIPPPSLPDPTPSPLPPELRPIDPECVDNALPNNLLPIAAKLPPMAQTVPATCRVGFDMNDLARNSYSISALNPAVGSQALTLELDIATYTHADTIMIEGTDQSGQKYTLFKSCRLRTFDRPEQFAGVSDQNDRPVDAAIREFRLQLRPGTKDLTFDFSGAGSPTYMRIIGLCDFNIEPPADGLLDRADKCNRLQDVKGSLRVPGDTLRCAGLP